jgi:DNA-binding IclR family transcriptional regulator
MIEKLFTLIKDGKWHNLTDLSDQSKVQVEKLNEFLQFLSQQGIIKYEDKTCRFKIKPEWQDILPDGTDPPFADRSSSRKKQS